MLQNQVNIQWILPDYAFFCLSSWFNNLKNRFLPNSFFEGVDSLMVNSMENDIGEQSSNSVKMELSSLGW